MRYYDIVDQLLELWRSQPVFSAAGIDMAVSINSPGTVSGMHGP